MLLCVFLSTHGVLAVVNTKSATSSDSNSKPSSNVNSNAGSNESGDSVAASSEKESNRREIPVGGLSDSYGVPIPSNSYGIPLNSYVPSIPSNPGLPVPVYGVPNGPVKNIVYPAPPPDIPPPAFSLPSPPTISGTYGPPKPVYGPPFKVPFHGPSLSFPKLNFHKALFGSGFHNGLSKSPRPSYGPPAPIFIPKPQYGPPKQIYTGPKLPKPSYGPPLKLNFVPPKPLFISSKPVHGPIKLTGTFGAPLATYGPPHTTSIFSPPKDNYGPPKEVHIPQASPVYGPPEPIHHGPPHPGVPAPPTPPDIKYDGWQPIPGLVSRPPSDAYGAPHHGGHIGGSIAPNGIAPPPLGGAGGGHVHTDLSLTYASSFGHGSGGIIGGGSGGQIGGFAHTPSDSYGAPLNSVTGSGGVVSSSVNEHISHGNHQFGGSFGGQDNSLSVIKSIGYEIYPSGSNGYNLNGLNAGVGVGSQISSGPVDSYGAPPADSYSADGPYPAAVSHKSKNVAISSSTSFKSPAPTAAPLIGGPTLPISSSGIGLIPPSGIYGVPPGGQYGAPLFSSTKNVGGHSNSFEYSSSLNALDINPPKSPVVFREPVPSGLIASIGESVAQKDAFGIEHSQTDFHGQAYIPPPVPDITKQRDVGNVNPLSNLYSLPSSAAPISFQSVVQGTGLGGDFGSNFNFGGNHGSDITLTSYTAPLGAIDSSYGIPLQPQALTSNFDQSFDLSSVNFGSSLQSTYTVPAINVQSTVRLPHDCSQHKEVPHISYGVPSGSASSYAASISSLNTNIGGQSNYQLSNVNLGPSQHHTDVPSNSVEIQGKSLGQEYFGKNSELQKSHEINLPNGVQNIPIQGVLGSYTLQIQSADGLSGQNGSPENVPHEQVLSDGLLQSILAAIEQPQQQHQLPHQQQFIQGYGDLQHASSGSVVQYQVNQPVADGEAQHSVSRQVVVTPPEQATTTARSVEPTTTEHSVSEADQSLHLIENNEIAVYFNNNNNEHQDVAQQSSASQSVDAAGTNNDDSTSSEVRNGQQYGSFVSFRTPHSNYVYGELKNTNGTQPAASA